MTNKDALKQLYKKIVGVDTDKNRISDIVSDLATNYPDPAPTLSSIAVTTEPTKKSYYEGDSFDPTGMVVKGTYSDGSKVVITEYTYSPAASLTPSDTAVTISYGGKTTTQAITVTALEVSSIAITTQPTKTTYTAGETFDPTGMVVTATYNSGTSAAVTNYTYAPNTALETTDTTITVTFGEKTATQSITVNAAQ